MRIAGFHPEARRRCRKSRHRRPCGNTLRSRRSRRRCNRPSLDRRCRRCTGPHCSRACRAQWEPRFDRAGSPSRLRCRSGIHSRHNSRDRGRDRLRSRRSPCGCNPRCRRCNLGSSIRPPRTSRPHSRDRRARIRGARSRRWDPIRRRSCCCRPSFRTDKRRRRSDPRRSRASTRWRRGWSRKEPRGCAR